MQIEIPDKTAADLRAMLARQGEDEDLEAYIRRTLSKRLLQESVREMKASTADVDPVDLADAIDEAVQETRKSHQEKRADADRP